VVGAIVLNTTTTTIQQSPVLHVTTAATPATTHKIAPPAAHPNPVNSTQSINTAYVKSVTTTMVQINYVYHATTDVKAVQIRASVLLAALLVIEVLLLPCVRAWMDIMMMGLVLSAWPVNIAAKLV